MSVETTVVLEDCDIVTIPVEMLPEYDCEMVVVLLWVSVSLAP